MGIHDDHRARMKERFAQHGLDNFDDVNVLELLLFYALPRKDTNPLAHALLDNFGSLRAVLEAPIEDLKKVSGIQDHTAIFLHLLPALCRRYLMSLSESVKVFSSTNELGKFFIPRFLFLRDEELHMLCLDDMNRFLCCRRLFSGVPNAAEINIRKIVEIALDFNATKIVLAHNHPDGVALPSQADRLLTDKIAAALQPMGICLLDHIIVGGDDFVSLREDRVHNV